MFMWLQASLHLPQTEKDGKRYVKYEVIGPNHVTVPMRFIKIITLEDWQGNRETRAYILLNQATSSKTPLDSFRTTF